MPLSVRGALKRLGYDPTVLSDAPEDGDPIRVTVEREDIHHAVAGAVNACVVHNAAVRALQAEDVLVFRHSAAVVWSPDRIERYVVRSSAPSDFDDGFLPVGESVELIPPRGIRKAGAGRPHHKGNAGKGTKPKAGKATTGNASSRPGRDVVTIASA